MSEDAIILAISNLIVYVILAVVAIWGVRQWRAEHKYRAKWELARKISLLALEFKAKFGSARSPMTFPHESAERPKRDDESPEDLHRLNEQYARLRRLEPLAEILTQLYAFNWEAEIILNQDFSPKIQMYNKAYIEVEEAIHRRFSKEYDRDDDKLKLTNILYGGSQNDALSATVDNATTEIINALKKHFK